MRVSLLQPEEPFRAVQTKAIITSRAAKGNIAPLRYCPHFAISGVAPGTQVHLALRRYGYDDRPAFQLQYQMRRLVEGRIESCDADDADAAHSIVCAADVTVVELRINKNGQYEADFFTETPGHEPVVWSFGVHHYHEKALPFAAEPRIVPRRPARRPYEPATPALAAATPAPAPAPTPAPAPVRSSAPAAPGATARPAGVVRAPPAVPPPPPPTQAPIAVPLTPVTAASLPHQHHVLQHSMDYMRGSCDSGLASFDAMSRTVDIEGYASVSMSMSTLDVPLFESLDNDSMQVDVACAGGVPFTRMQRPLHAGSSTSSMSSGAGARAALTDALLVHAKEAMCILPGYAGYYADACAARGLPSIPSADLMDMD